MAEDGIDLTAISVAFISASASIASAIIVTRGNKEKKEKSKAADNAIIILLVACLGVLAWRSLRIDAAGALAAMAALACVCAGARIGERPPRRLGGEAGSVALQIIFFVSTVLMIASVAVITLRNPEPVTVVALCCVVAGSVLNAFTILRGSIQTVYSALLSVGSIVIIASIIAATVVTIPGTENGQKAWLAITSPQDNAVIECKCMIEGECENMPEGQAIWIFACLSGEEQGYLRAGPAEIISEKAWRYPINMEEVLGEFGEEMYESGVEIIAVMADSEKLEREDYVIGEDDTVTDSIIVTIARITESRIQITYPANEDVIECECTVRGEYRNMPDGQAIWIFARPSGGEEFFLKTGPAETNPDGTWDCQIDMKEVLGGFRATQYEFRVEIFAVMADSEKLEREDYVFEKDDTISDSVTVKVSGTKPGNQIEAVFIPYDEWGTGEELFLDEQMKEYAERYLNELVVKNGCEVESIDWESSDQPIRVIINVPEDKYVEAVKDDFRALDRVKEVS